MHDIAEEMVGKGTNIYAGYHSDQLCEVIRFDGSSTPNHNLL